jgi:flagellar assembly protein FliH
MQHWTPPSFDATPVVEAVDVPMRPVSPEPAPVHVGGSVNTSVAPASPQALFLRGLQEGLEEGRQQGLALGREEGFDKGRQDGFQAGFQQGYQSSLEKIESLTASLQTLVNALSQLPSDIEASLNELVYDTALRLAGKESMDRSVFQRALQDALTRLPRPGESLVMRVPQADLDSWQAVVADGPSRFALVLQADESLQPGHAFVDIQGTRLDVGARARQALVRSALGLLTSDHADAKG